MTTDYKIQVGDTSIGVTSVVNSVEVYNLTVNVVRMTKVNDPSKGISETAVTIVASMPCTIKWLSAKESIIFNKETQELDGTLLCDFPAGVTIENTDKIYFNSAYYEIVQVEDVRNLGLVLKIALKRIK